MIYVANESLNLIGLDADHVNLGTGFFYCLFRLIKLGLLRAFGSKQGGNLSSL